MVRAELSSDSELEESENSSSEEEALAPGCNGQKQEEASEYEKQRLARIAENKARMEALGLSKVASSLMGSPQNSRKHKGKRKVVDEDEDYRPTNDGDGDGDGDNLDDDDEEFVANKASKSNKRKVKNRSPKPKKKTPVQKQVSCSGYTDDEDQLMQAIALSLQHSAEVPGPALNERKENSRFQEDTGRGKRKKSQFTSRVQMTEDEVVLHFFQFDEAGRGSINIRDLRRVAVAHDFIWTDKELADMIHCFDSDGDGKLNLDDFRKIVNRCNMIKASENS